MYVAGLALRRLTCGLCPPRAAVYLLLSLPAAQRLRVFLLARDRQWPARPGRRHANLHFPLFCCGPAYSMATLLDT